MFIDCEVNPMDPLPGAGVVDATITAEEKGVRSQLEQHQ